MSPLPTLSNRSLPRALFNSPKYFFILGLGLDPSWEVRGAETLGPTCLPEVGSREPHPPTNPPCGGRSKSLGQLPRMAQLDFLQSEEGQPF